MEEMEKVCTEQYEEFCFDTGLRKIWIRRRVCSTQAEILTDDATVAKCLSGLGRENPTLINVLSEEGEMPFHCIVGREISINFIPSSGHFEFWLETLAAEETGNDE